MNHLILGAGNMVKALIPPYIKSSSNEGETFSVFTPSGKSAQKFSDENNISLYTKKTESIGHDCIWLGMKPQQIKEAALEFASNCNEETVLISLLAGVSASHLENLFGTKKIIRIMPNTPASVGVGVNAIYRTEQVSAGEWANFLKHFKSSGTFFIFQSEEELDIITPYSGSGPAYFFEIIRIMTDDLSARGIDPKVALEMIAMTMKGSAELCLQSSLSPKSLRDNVTSKGGVTFKALEHFEKSGLEDIFTTALDCAYKRTLELKGI